MWREKRKEGKDPEGGSKNREEVGNDDSLASMFAKQQPVSVLNKTRHTYNPDWTLGFERFVSFCPCDWGRWV